MKKITSIILCIVIVLSLCSCSVTDSNSFTMGVFEAVNSFDPHFAETDAEKIISTNCFEGLLRFDKQGNINLAGATAYTMGNNGLLYTFKLNPNAQWYVSSEAKKTLKELEIKDFNKSVTAQDYVYGIERYMQSYPDDFSSIKSVSATDEYTLKIALNKADHDFLYKLTAYGVYPCNAAFHEATSGSYAKSTATILFNGPYYVKESSASETIIKKNPDYNGNIQIQNKQILLYTTGNEDIMKKRFNDGTYNIYLSHNYNRLENVTPSFVSVNEVWGLTFNCKTGIGSSQGLRYVLLSTVDFSTLTIPEFATSKAESIIPGNFLAGDKKYSEFATEKYAYKQNIQGAIDTLDALQKKYNKTSYIIDFAVPLQMKPSAETLVENWKNLFGDKLIINLTTFNIENAESVALEGNYDIAILPLSPANKTALGIVKTISGAPCYYEKISSINTEKKLTTIITENILTYQDTEKTIVDNGAFIPLFFTGKSLYLQDDLTGIYLADGGELLYFYEGEQK